MQELLKRWAEVEPSVVDIQIDGHGRLLCVHIDNEWFVYDDCAFRMMMVLQCAVQEAIEARGWYWGINNLAGPCATVYAGTGIVKQQPADTPAEALLSAYLQAIEATTLQPA